MLIPEGRWLAVPVQQETNDGSMLNIVFAPSSKKGTLGGSVMFEIKSGPAAGEHSLWTGWMSDGALKNTVRGWRSIGFIGDDIGTFHDQDPLKLNEVELTVEHETQSNGAVRAKIQWVNTPRKFMDRSAVQAAAASIKEKLAQFIDEAPPVDDSEIPF
jgi:hypothetical protein